MAYVDNGFFGAMALLILMALIAQLFLMKSELNKCKSECKEDIAYKDEIIKEFRRIRHEYNNIIQVVVSSVEDGDLEGLREYKQEMISRTQALNGSSIAQLANVKDMKILRLVYDIFSIAEDAGVILKVYIPKEIRTMLWSNKSFKELQSYLKFACSTAAKKTKAINFSICPQKDELCFTFEGTVENVSKDNSFEHPHGVAKSRNILFNTFYKEDKFVQEIIVAIHKA